MYFSVMYRLCWYCKAFIRYASSSKGGVGENKLFSR